MQKTSLILGFNWETQPPPLRSIPRGMNLLSPPLPHLKPGSDDETSDGEETQVSAADLEALISGRYPIPPEGDGEPSPAPEGLNKWVCAQPSSQKATNYNTHITEKLEVLAKAYSVQGDKWRALGYAKAINALKSFHKPVTSYQVPGGEGGGCRGGMWSSLCWLEVGGGTGHKWGSGGVVKIV